MDKLIITDLQFHGHCGLSEAERRAGQRLSVDLEFYVDLQGVSDSKRQSEHPDYAQISAVVLEIGRKESFELLESLAERLAQGLLKQFAAREVVVRLKKVHPPVEAIRGYFGVEIRRSAPGSSAA